MLSKWHSLKKKKNLKLLLHVRKKILHGFFKIKILLVWIWVGENIYDVNMYIYFKYSKMYSFKNKMNWKCDFAGKNKITFIVP